MDDKIRDLRSVPNLTSNDVTALLAVLVGGSKRVERVPLSAKAIWIKRYGTEKPPVWRFLQGGFSRLVPFAFLRPSAYLPPKQMAEREVRRIGQFSEQGFAVPQVLYASKGAIALSDVGTTVQRRLGELKSSDPKAHDDLLVACAAELGRLHAAGLCHGRPYPRDMFFAGGRIGFMDFEEEPQTVMPLSSAQARDIWLLFLQIATSARLGLETRDRAYIAWSERAPPEAVAELRRMTRFLGGFLSLARLIGRVHMGSDLQRFIVATSYLMHAFTNYPVD
ncbi:MAG: serine/threonine protein phosphatase [Rhizobiaceae bacterium]|nr:serine/threonine protein phosphatase [Rhizobiaceae bacterium]